MINAVLPQKVILSFQLFSFKGCESSVSFPFRKDFYPFFLCFTIGHYFGRVMCFMKQTEFVLRSTVKKNDNTLNTINCNETKTMKKKPLGTNNWK